MNPTLNDILTRRSIRRFKPELPDRETLEKIIEAGLYAASGKGMQSSMIVAVTDKALRDRLTEGILSAVPGAKLNGPREGRLPNNCSVSFDRIDGEALLLRLDLAGIAGSSGSACTAGSQEISHVLKAIGLTEEQAKGSLRLTVGPENTEEEIDEAIRAVKEIVEDLRSMFRG